MDAPGAADQGPDLGLAQVSSPTTAGVDVIFVHGLNGSRSLTWTNSNDEFWPSWIADSVPDARVWTYGYNSALWKSPSQDAIELHTARLLAECWKHGVGKPSRPGPAPKVVFVCHSLGGILVKAAVTQIFTGLQESSWAFLKDQISTIIFVATPHRGSEWANRLYTLYLGAGSRFVQLLRRNDSALLSLIAERFNNIWGDRPVINFREQKGILPLGLASESMHLSMHRYFTNYSQIVKPQDARTNCRREACFDEPYNHRRIAKVKSRDERLYATLINHLEQHYGKISVPVPAPVKASPTSRAPEPQTFPWRKIHLKAFYRFFLMDKQDPTKAWETLDEEFSPDVLPTHTGDQLASKFQSGTFSFNYPGHESTLIILTVPSKVGEMRADWTIISPNSIYHPGRHDGHLEIHSEFPFKSPKAIWDSPIISAYVISRYGRTCTAYEYDLWSPRESSFYKMLYDLASIVVHGPALGFAPRDLVSTEPPHILGNLIGLRLSSADDLRSQSWMARVTNLLARAYNRFDDDDDEEDEAGSLLGSSSTVSGSDSAVSFLTQVSDHQREVSVMAINDALTNLAAMVPSYLSSPSTFRQKLVSRGLEDPESDLRNIRTLKHLLAKERQWVDGINTELGGIAVTGWGIAESYMERKRRLRLDG